MTNISKRPLKPEQQVKLFKQFSSLFITAGDRKITSLFSDLFTDSEKIMFIKRVGIIFMLTDQQSNYEIARSLQVSESTVRSTKHKYTSGQYRNIVKVMESKTFNHDQFWSVLDTVLRAGLPPIGKGRWKSTLQRLNQN